MAGFELTSEETKRRALAIVTAVSLHSFVFWVLLDYRPPAKPLSQKVLPVFIVQPTPSPNIPLETPAPRPPSDETQTIENKPVPTPSVKPAPQPRQDPPENSVERDPDPIPGPLVQPPRASSSLPLQASPVPNGATLIPDRWRLPPGARTSLENTALPGGSLFQDLDCLKGFRTECAEVRREVFADQQLSEMDLVWMPTLANAGLSDPRFRGMSERQIREELNIPFAGENGLYIPFTNIGIDGAWWDSLHGVNKSCTYEWMVAETGRREIRKVCPELKGRAKDRQGVFETR